MPATHLPVTELYPDSPDGGYDLGYSPHGATGIQYDHKHFLFVRQGGEYTGDARIHILKSSDSGATWSDVANFDAGQVPSYAVCRDGNVAYILYTDTKYNGTSHCTALSVRSFHLDTGILSGVIALGPAPEKLWHGGAYIFSGRVGIAIATRAPGDMLAIYPSEPAGGNNRLSFLSFNGASFGSPIPISGVSGELYVASSALVDSSGVWHAIIARTVAATGVGSLLHLSMDAAGTTVGVQEVVTGLNIGGLGPPPAVGRLTTFTVGGGEKIAFPDGETGKVYHASAGAVAPSWSNVSFSPSPAPQYTSTIGWGMGTALLPTAGGLMVFWTMFGTSPDYYTRDKLGKIYSRTAAYGALGTWSPASVVMESANFAASTVMAYYGADEAGVFAGFVQDYERGEDSWWRGYPVGGGGPTVTAAARYYGM